MIVNQSCPLFLTDLYVYDFEACYWNILKRIGYDLTGIEFEDKKKRNIQLGILQKENPFLANHLFRIAESLVSEFLFRNQVQDNEIIVRQRDGVILTKPLVRNTMSGLEFKKRDFLSFLIVSVSRKNILFYNSKEIQVRGVPFVYDKVKQYYQKFATLNFVNKKQLCIQLQKLKNGIRRQKPKFFCIPNSDDSVSVFLIGEGQVVLSKKSIRLLSKKNIDFNRYFDHYFRPFTESIFLELIKRRR